MRKILSLILIAFVVIVSGCTKTTVSDKDNGIIIQSLIVDPSEAEAGEEVFFSMDVKNVGGAKATNIRAELIGLTDNWILQDHTPLIDELFPPEPGIEGGTDTVEWIYTAPRMDTTLPYKFDGRVEYHYTTHYEALVRIATRDWIKTFPVDQQDAEKAKLGVAEASPQLGPIHVDFKIRSGLIHNDPKRGVVLVIQNVGSGRPLNDEVTVTVESPRLDCPIENPIELSRGQTKQIRCSVDLSGIDKWKNINIDVDLDYDYYVMSSGLVTVLAKYFE